MALFNQEKPANIPPPDTSSSALRTMKVLEEKINNLNKKTEIIENNILRINQRQSSDIKILNAKAMNLEKELSLVKKRMVEMASDLKNFARREQVDTIQKYVNYWEPISFVTHQELDEALKK